MTTLHGPFERAAAENPDAVAVLDPSRMSSISYRELNGLADAIGDDLRRSSPGSRQRVGVYAPKSIPTVAALLGILKSGGAYVPADVGAPVDRAVRIFRDCGVGAVVVERSLADSLRSAWGGELESHELGRSSELLQRGCDLVIVSTGESEPSPVEQLAYILCTSGSTGVPKGVMHTHASARCFVDWCSRTFEPGTTDRFSSHAPFHFDLSILDLYVPLSHGAAVVLIGEDDGKNPLRLAPLISESGVSVWYSTPSILRLLLEHGRLEQYPAAPLRLVLFAGEVFAPRHLRRLQQAWPGRRYLNLYGPTETNVCTAYELHEVVPADQVEPYPIGKPITGDVTMVAGPGDRAVDAGEEGELLVHGGTVMAGYWNRPDLDAAAFHVDDQRRRWYRTGDVVRMNGDGDYEFLGRRDRMIKRRGYRVELGEIEATLYRHSDVAEAAVVAVPSHDDGVLVHAFLCWDDPARPSTIELKRFCATHLPLYMVPDRFTFLDDLPKTSTDKIDYVRLKAISA